MAGTLNRADKLFMILLIAGTVFVSILGGIHIERNQNEPSLSQIKYEQILSDCELVLDQLALDMGPREALAAFNPRLCIAERVMNRMGGLDQAIRPGDEYR